jgi:hypothetical protein
VEAARGQPERGVRLFGASEALRISVSGPTWSAERAAFESNLAAARAMLDQSAWEAAWEQGKSMSMEQAIEYALEES